MSKVRCSNCGIEAEQDSLAFPDLGHLVHSGDARNVPGRVSGRKAPASVKTCGDWVPVKVEKPKAKKPKAQPRLREVKRVDADSGE